MIHMLMYNCVSCDQTLEGLKHLPVYTKEQLLFARLQTSKMLVQACLRAPPMVADEAKLAIVFTYVLVQACLRAPPVVADKAKLAIVFHLLFSFFAFCFSPTLGELP